MCGIALIIGKNAVPDKNEFLKMLSLMSHRGEAAETFENSSILAGVNRLKIIDPDNAVQPMLDPENKRIILFNGEIYNYKSLKKKLQKKYRFKTDSDTETVLTSYAEYGAGCLDHLQGQFAFVIVNLEDMTFFAARDHFGIKPLYYAESQGNIYFSSEIKGLTFLSGKISGIKPGCYMDEVREHQYFTPVKLNRDLSERESGDELHTRLSNAVKKRVQTDLPVGVLYSGGIDSTIILSQAVKYHPRVTAFTIGIEGSDDIVFAEKYCRENSIKHVVLTVKRKDINLGKIKRGIEISELSEYGDIVNAVISIDIFRLIRKHGIKIVLTGDGSDELFAGYSMYSHDKTGSSHEELLMVKLLNLHRTELQRADRCSMASGIEVRVPFLDDEVVSLSLSIPEGLKRRNNTEKWCLRESFWKELPEYIIKRGKNPMSYSTGIHEWIRFYKPWFRHYYDRMGYCQAEPIRMDFSYILKKHNYDIRKAVSEAEKKRDYSKARLLLEMMKAWVRSVLF